MHYNPCGRAVDIGRRPYSTLVRPFRDSNITVQIDWVPARKEDGLLPFPSRICSLDFVPEKHAVTGVGEVYGAERTYNRRKPIGGPPRDHICGTADQFKHGEVYDPTSTPTKYLAVSGLPTCCDPMRREAVAFIGVGTSADADAVRLNTPSLLTVTLSSDGTVLQFTFEQSTQLVPGYTITINGAVTTGTYLGTVGACQHVHTFTLDPAIPPGAVIAVSISDGSFRRCDQPPEQGAILAIVGFPVTRLAPAPLPPTPGTDCPTSPALALGTVYSYPGLQDTLPPRQDWFRWEGLTIGATYRLTSVSAGDVAPAGPFDDLGDCGGPPSEIVASGSGHIDFISGTGDVVVFFQGTTNDDPYHFLLELLS